MGEQKQKREEGPEKSTYVSPCLVFLFLASVHFILTKFPEEWSYKFLGVLSMFVFINSIGCAYYGVNPARLLRSQRHGDQHSEEDITRKLSSSDHVSRPPPPTEQERAYTLQATCL